MMLVIVCAPCFAALLVDDCETGTLTNSKGGQWFTYTDGISSVTFTAGAAPGYAGSAYCRKMDSTILNPDVYNAFTGFMATLNSGYTGEDLSEYYGVRFYAKGSADPIISVPIDATHNTFCGYDDYRKALTVDSTDWQLFEVPFNKLSQGGWGCTTAWSALKVQGVQISFGGNVGTNDVLYLDNIEFYREDEAINTPNAVFVSFKPKINQIGYLPLQKKFFTVVTQTAGTNAAFEVKRVSDDSAVFSGAISGAVITDPDAGEDVVSGEFSGLNTPGEYYVEVNNQRSYNFLIADDAYDTLFKDALRGFYSIRCGTDMNDPVTGLVHGACHMADGGYNDKSGTGDLTGGWHNAGDFGKWTHEHAFSVAYMLWLYELKTQAMQGLDINTPESGGVSDILQQAKWGLEFMLKMQNPDGSIYNKVDTEPMFVFGTAPENDPLTRTAKPQSLANNQYSTIPAATFCAVMAQSYRVFLSIDPAFAARCSASAKAAWDWLDTHPKTGETDPYYTDANYYDELMWAQAEMYRLTGDGTFAAAFQNSLNAINVERPAWYNPMIFGCMSMYFNPSASQAIKDLIKAKTTEEAANCITKSDASGYRVAMSTGEYWWGSLTNVIGRGNLFIFANLCTGDDKYLDYALFQLDFVLGVNALEQVFVTGFGTIRNDDPFHWIKRVYGIMFAGWPSGGPNNQGAGIGGAADQPLADLIAAGTPAQKCWVDMGSSAGSWASNEGATDHLAALIFLAGFFYSKTGAPDTPDNPEHAEENLKNVYCYPSLFKQEEGHKGITFLNLTSRTNLRVFNLKGELVYKAEEETPQGSMFWDLQNRRKNNRLSPGLYIYVISNENKEVKKGRLAIVR